jgi:hypothetical protein
MHEVDLRNFIAGHPDSALAELADHGISRLLQRF